MSDNFTLIEDGRISFNHDDGFDQDLVRYCEEECKGKCRSSFMEDGRGCDCVINRLYCAMVRLSELEQVVVPELLKALERALLFITNGRELGYIRMPDVDSGDTALETPNIIRNALAKAKGEALE